MKFKNLKKPIAILMTLALIIGVFSISFVASAEGNFYYDEEVTIGSETAMNIDNWNVIEGPTTIRAISDTSIHLKAEIGGNGSVLVDRIQAKTPANARITAVNFTVVTQAISKKYPLEFIYDYNGLGDYKALGLVGNKTSSDTIYGRTQLTGTNQGSTVVSSTSWDKGSKHGKNWRNTFKVNFKYNYAADGTITASISIVKTSGSGEVATLTNFNIGEVSNPCVILSGGSKTKSSTAAMDYNTETDYGRYSEISYSYQPAIDMTSEIEAFKTSYPITALADVNAENAIECGKAANKAIEAYAALTDEKIKEALSDYAQEAQRIVEKVEIINSGCYAEDFSDSTLFEDVSVLTGTQVRGGTATNTFVNNTYSYENGVMKFVQTTGVDSLANSLKGTNVKMVQPLNDSREISKVTAKIALSGGGKWNPFKMNLGKAGSADEYHGIELYYSVNSETGLLTSLNFRVARPNANASTDNDATATSETILATKAPDINNSATYFNLEYIISAAGRPTAKLYAADGTTLLAKVAISDTNKLFVYSGTNTIGFGSLGLTAGYVDDLKVWYDGSETFVAPTMDGASIATTANVGEQDLRFQASYDPNATVSGNFKAVEYGMLVMTAAKMPSTNELTMAAVGKEELNVIVGKKNLADGETLPSTYYLELNGSGTLTAFNATIETIVGKRFVARAYVAYQDTVTGHIYYVYSDNENEKGTKDGQASKSVISVAKAIAQNVIANGAVDDGTIAGIISQTTTTTALQREQLLTFICNNKDKVVA